MKLEVKTFYSFKLKSHPDKLLKNHLKNVGILSREIIKSKIIKNKEIFIEIAYLIGITHDFGKTTTYFQNWIENEKRTQYAQHGFISSLVGYLVIKDFLSNLHKLKEFWYLPGVAWIVINKHHGNLRDIHNEEIKKLKDPDELELIEVQLTDIYSHTLVEVEEIYESLNYPQISKILEEIKNPEKVVQEIYKDIKKICMDGFKSKILKYYFLILFFYSVLLDADKLDASGRDKLPERIEISGNIIDEYKKIKFGEPKTKIDILRENAYNDVITKIDEIDLNGGRIFSINLPTGCGKTLTGLSFALKLREKVKLSFGFTPRIIYSLPFLSIIDQNAKIIEDILRFKYKKIPSNLFIVHHHLSDVKYREIKGDELNIEELNRSLLLTEGWHSEIIITTFVQLFYSLITNKNRAARKFHNIVNSMIILDEIQSIPYRYWLLINESLKYLANNFNCWIILMTATKPLIFRDQDTKELVISTEKYFNAFNRVIFNFNLTPKNFDEFKHEILEEILQKNENILVVLNTINSCKKLYRFLKDELAAFYSINKKDIKIDEDGVVNFPDLELINLSTLILPQYRLKRINRIRDMEDNKRKVIVTTQLIEAGVDISADIMYRDFAPLDCIIQSAGRCNRNNEKDTGSVNIIILKNGNKEFYKYIYDSTLIDTTEKVIKTFKEKIEEKDFVLASIEKYYKMMLERGSKEDSYRLLDSLNKLEFSGTTKFDLFEESLSTKSIFVEIDDLAESIRKKMEEILENKKGFERKLGILELRKEINNYTIQVRYSKKIEDKIDSLNPIDGLKDFKYISKKEVNKYYKTDSGLGIDESLSNYFII